MCTQVFASHAHAYHTHSTHTTPITHAHTMCTYHPPHTHTHTHPSHAALLKLGAPESYYYLSQSGCVSDPTINDVSDFAKVRSAFQVMKLGAQQVTDLLGVVSAILHIGNITFVTAAGAQISDRSGTLPPPPPLLHPLAFLHCLSVPFYAFPFLHRTFPFLSPPPSLSPSPFPLLSLSSPLLPSIS